MDIGLLYWAVVGMIVLGRAVSVGVCMLVSGFVVGISAVGWCMYLLRQYKQNSTNKILKERMTFMVDYGKVRSTVKPEEKVVDDYSVWVNSDIEKIEVTTSVSDEENETHTEYEFNQVQYSKDEYIKLIDAKNAKLESTITDTQMALCEVYELMG